MAKNEFGIMNMDPKSNVRYDDYEPEKYGCISVHDDYILPLLERLSCMDCFWHTLDNPKKNLAYWGVTLIPPDSLQQFIESLVGIAGTEELKGLLVKAKAENKFVIHFGI